MKKLTKIVIIILMLTLSASLLIGCSKTSYTEAESFDLLTNAIKQSLDAKTYYMTEKVRKDKHIVENTFNLIDDMDDDIDMSRFSSYDAKSLISALTPSFDYQNQYIAGQSLKKSAPKKPTASDYVLRLAKIDKKGVATTEKAGVPVKKLLEDEYFAKLTLASKLAFFNLDFESYSFTAEKCGTTRKGVSTFVTFKIVQAGHIYNGNGNTITFKAQIMYGRIYQIKTINSQDYVLDAVYEGPKVDVPKID